MDSELRSTADQACLSSANDKRHGMGPTAFILKMIAAATIICSFIQAVRGECGPMTVIQFWLSLFVAAIVQKAADDSHGDSVEVRSGRGDCRAS